MKRKMSFLLIIVMVLGSLLFAVNGYYKGQTGANNVKPNEPSANLQNKPKDPFYGDDPMLAGIEAPEGFDWRQFEGITLNFLVENNINANVLTKESQEFTKVTGININIRPLDFSTFIEKINIDFISKTGKYQLVYVDPYQTLNRFSTNFEDLNNYYNDPALPHIPGGLEDFFEQQVNVDSYFIDKSALYAVPFDTTTMILYYRKDIFEKYREKFMEEKGYDWTPGKKGFTWERYLEVAEWIDKNVPDTEVKYGSGHMAQRHNSIFCDFSNVMAAYGGDYYRDINVDSLGLKQPIALSVKEKSFIDALDMYKKIIKSSANKSLGWDWYDAAEAFKRGEMAMMPNWDENASSIENPEISKVAGKVGYSILPYGPKGSANIFGGSGIGINKHATEEEKKAAWLFIVWATSPKTQLFVLKHPEGGCIPSRMSAYQDEDIKKVLLGEVGDSSKYKNMLQLPAVLEAWKKENAYYRPKIGNFYYIEQIMVNNLHEMIKKDISAEDTARTIYEQIQGLNYNKTP